MSWLDRFFSSRNYGSMQYNGAVMPPEPNFNFVGAGVVVTDDPSNLRTTITIGSGGGSFTAAGDLSGSSSSQVVEKVKGTTITTAGGALGVGLALRTTAVGTADWGVLNIAGGGTGISAVGNEGEILSMNGAHTAYEFRNYIGFGATANVPATGMVRAGATGTVPVIIGLSAGIDYDGVLFNAVGSTWTFGSTAFYTQQNCYDFRITASTGGQVFIGATAQYTDANSIITDLTTVSKVLAADFTTTVATATALNHTFNVLNGEIWEIEFWCTCLCASGGIKFSLMGPAASVVEGWLDSVTTGVTTLSRQRFTAINTLSATATNTGVSINAPTAIYARVTMGAGGTFSIGVASVTSGQLTTVRAGSYLTARRAAAV